MKINSLHVEGVGLFDKLDVTFNEGFNFITGPNASGKTSILRNISLALSSSSINQFRYDESPELFIDYEYGRQNCRVGYGKNFIQNHQTYQGASIREWKKPPYLNESKVYIPYELDQENAPIAPLFISAFRKISYLRIQGMTQEVSVVDQIKSYRHNAANRLNGTEMPNVKQWVINRYFQIEKSWAFREKRNWDWLISNLKQIGPLDADFKYFETRRDLEPIFSIKGKQCYLEELSAGYQAILSITFCIFDWIESTNEGDNMLVKNAKGSVLIDELDVHLHPEWQLTIRDSLEVMFPNLQFIITTHSPHIIASAKPNELLIIPEHDGTLELKPSEKTYSGWNTDQILEELMGVKSLANKDYSQLIDKALDLVEENKPEELSAAIKELSAVSHSNDTIVKSLEIKLASLKLKQ